MRLLIFIFFFITSCSNDMNIESFSKNTPAFKLEEYFNGKTEAWGMLKWFVSRMTYNSCK